MLFQYIGVQSQVLPPQIEQSFANGEQSYNDYYYVHRTDDSAYNMGQILSSHVGSLKTQGYQAVISFRTDKEPTTRIPTDNSTGPVANLEFGDEQGLYSLQLEQKALEAAGIAFYSVKIYICCVKKNN
jgi:hypothetical protein